MPAPHAREHLSQLVFEMLVPRGRQLGWSCMGPTTSRAPKAPPSAARANSLSHALHRPLKSSQARLSRPRTAQPVTPGPAEQPPATRAERQTDDWTAPDDKEGAIVRATYAYFAQNPVRGDGKVAGEEMTRHKASTLPWADAGRANEAAVSDSNINSPAEGPSSSESRERRARPATAGAHEGPGIGPGGSVSRTRSDSRACHARAAVAATSLLEPPGKAAGPASTIRDGASISSSHASRDEVEDNSSYSSLPVPGSAHSARSARTSPERRQASPLPGIRCASPEEEEAEEAEERPLDRYGFFQADAEGRIDQGRALALPVRVFQKLPYRPRLEAIRSDGRLGASSPRPALRTVALTNQVPRDEESDSSARREARLGLRRRDQIIKSQHGRDQARTSKWQQMLTTGSAGKPIDAAAGVEFKTDVSPGSIRRRVFKGIPDAWRPVVWPLLIRLKARSDAPTRTEGKTHWTHYQHRHQRSASESIVAGPAASRPRTREEKAFVQSQSRPSRYDVQIDLDVPRTMNGHWAFYTRYGKGQVQLFQVLHAMSLHCPDTCGYCQGMGPIAATLLLQLPSAVAAYTALAGLHDHYHVHDTFQPGFPGLQQLFFVHQRLVGAYIPSLAAALEEAEITPSSYATRWYITLFHGTVPYATQLRIWDAYLLLGPDVLLLTGLALLWGVAQTLPLDEMGKKTRLLSPRAPRAKRGFETLLHALSSFFVVEDDDALMDWVARMLDRSHVQHRLAQAHETYAELEARGATKDIVL